MPDACFSKQFLSAVTDLNMRKQKETDCMNYLCRLPSINNSLARLSMVPYSSLSEHSEWKLHKRIPFTQQGEIGVFLICATVIKEPLCLTKLLFCWILPSYAIFILLLPLYNAIGKVRSYKQCPGVYTLEMCPWLNKLSVDTNHISIAYHLLRVNQLWFTNIQI